MEGDNPCSITYHSGRLMSARRNRASSAKCSHETVKYLVVVGDYGYSYNRVSNTSTGKGGGGFVDAPATWGSVLEPTHPYKTKISQPLENEASTVRQTDDSVISLAARAGCHPMDEVRRL